MAIAGLAVLRDQPGLFGSVASNPTAWRVLSDGDDAALVGPRAARAHARELHSRRSGFEYDLVVKQRPSSEPVWRIPLRIKGLTPVVQSDGSIHFLDAENKTHSVIPVPLMWDAVVDEHSGEPANRAPVKITVEQSAELTRRPILPRFTVHADGQNRRI